MRNDERYLAFSSAVFQAFLEESRIIVQFFLFTFSTCSSHVTTHMVHVCTVHTTTID